jgi:uncharacterized protein with von Willebrand factor type A (vWA) domain
MSRGAAVTRKLVTFGRILREAGLEVGPGRLQDAMRGLDAIDLASRDQVYHALRCTLVSRRDDIPAFDLAFAAFWEQVPTRHAETHPDPAAALPAPPPPVVSAHEAGDGPEPEADDDRTPLAAALASPDELLRHRDFADMTDEELHRLRRLIRDVATGRPLRRSRRLSPAPAPGSLDARRTLRAAMRTGGLPLERAWRRPKLVPRRLVVLCDVSGSMEPYARAMLMFLQALATPDGAARTVEVFAFGTRLTRLTGELAGGDAALVLDRSAALLPDWGGGTRIGESLATYNRRHGRHGGGRGTVAVIVSDGWERGDLDLLDRELGVLRRNAHELIWVNPLTGHAGFEPLAGGMQTAMRHVDRLLEGHNLRSLEELARVLAEVPAGVSGSRRRAGRPARHAAWSPTTTSR